jgi:hypothetical protein
MSSTRHADFDAPLSQERYMSSPEYVELRGVSGSAVTAKAALMGHPDKRSLLFFLQAISLQPGGLRKFNREFLDMFADRIGTPTMHRLGMKPGQKYDVKTEEAIRSEMASTSAAALAAFMDVFGESCSAERIRRGARPVEEFVVDCREKLSDLPGFIIELCINPHLRFSVPGETEAARERERMALEEQFEKTSIYGAGDDPHYASASLPYFRDIIGALFEYKRRYEEAARRDFLMTEVGRQVFETLDVCLATGKMVVTMGGTRIGKTTNAEAWCNQHLGEARFVSLSGILNRTGVFRAIAKALGLAASRAYTATKLQAMVEDVLQRSRLVLVIDEAHFLLSATERTRCAPELIDWVDTALCNHRVPCALVCTPQLIGRMARHEHQAGWNAEQWRGRVKRFCTLPEAPKSQDLRAGARKLLPSADKPTIDYIVGYALSSKLPWPAVVDAVDEARLLVEREGREVITFEDVDRAIRDYCVPSSAAMLQTFAVATDRKGGRKSRTVAAEPDQHLGEPRGRDISPGLAPSAIRGNQVRLQEPVSTLIDQRDEAILTPV